MSKKTWIIFVAICVVVLGGLIVLSRQNQVDVSSIDQSKVIEASKANGNIADHVFGPKVHSKVVLMEYGDFQCPACGAAHPTIKAVTEEYEDKLTFIFRNNPLTTIHPNARVAAAAVEAAGLQGKYWQMHNTVFETQDEWSSSSIDQRTTFFEKYAKQVGVKDMTKFKADMQSKPVNEKINFDLALGKKVPVTGTPTIMLNGKKLEADVWNDKVKLKAAVEDALN